MNRMKCVVWNAAGPESKRKWALNVKHAHKSIMSVLNERIVRKLIALWSSRRMVSVKNFIARWYWNHLLFCLLIELCFCYFDRIQRILCAAMFITLLMSNKQINFIGKHSVRQCRTGHFVFCENISQEIKCGPMRHFMTYHKSKNMPNQIHSNGQIKCMKSAQTSCDHKLKCSILLFPWHFIAMGLFLLIYFYFVVFIVFVF